MSTLGAERVDSTLCLSMASTVLHADDTITSNAEEVYLAQASFTGEQNMNDASADNTSILANEELHL